MPRGKCRKCGKKIPPVEYYREARLCAACYGALENWGA